MTNFKKKILSALKNKNKINETLDYLSKIQKNLLTNHSNPVFSNADKNKLLKKHTEFQELGESLYRHNMLTENGIESDVDENVVLKGGISNFIYIWHSENSDTTCEKCAELDGQEFSFEDEIPERPHPNCKCTVEIVDGYEYNNNPNNNNEDEEPCDCLEEIESILLDVEDLDLELKTQLDECDEFQIEVENLLQDFQNFRQNVIKEKDELSQMTPCNENCEILTGMAIDITNDKQLGEVVENLIKYNETAKEVYLIFENEKNEMERLNDKLDKYHHANANCNSATRGEAHARWAIIYSISKEIKDYIVKVFIEHNNAGVIFEDCLKDLKADWYGIQKAKEPGCCSDKVRDVYEVIK